MDRLAFSVGTRAELIKLFPVLKRLNDYTLIHTGQHSLGGLIDDFGLKEPDVVLSPPPKKTSKFHMNTPKAFFWSMGMVWRIRKALKEEGVEVLGYHGDTMSTAASAIASKLGGVKGVHLEAGLRSGSIWEPFPEEISRKIADNFSHLALAVSKGTKKNLEDSRWFRGKVVNVGNTIIDSALEIHDMMKKDVETPKGDYAIVTAHRHENLRSRERMENIVRIVKDVPIDTYFFAHDNTITALKKFNLLKSLSKDVKMVKLSNYRTFIPWLANCRLLLTDGGSVQEESLVFKKPCVILRKRTERQEGLETGINFLTELDAEYAEERIGEVLEPGWNPPRFSNPYGKRGVSSRVVKELKKLF